MFTKRSLQLARDYIDEVYEDWAPINYTGALEVLSFPFLDQEAETSRQNYHQICTDTLITVGRHSNHCFGKV